MAVSVYAFGTGGKRANTFKDIYFSIEDVDGVGVLYTKTGEYSAILKMENPVQKYSADTDCYYDFTNLMTAVVQTLGEGYALHKQDVFVRRASTVAPCKSATAASSSPMPISASSMAVPILRDARIWSSRRKARKVRC